MVAALAPTNQPSLSVCLLCRQGREATEFLLAKNGFTFSAFCSYCRINSPEEVKRIQRSFARGDIWADPRGTAEKRQCALEARILPILQAFGHRRNLKRKGVNLMAEEYAVWLAKLPDRVAVIVAKTYAEMGDSAVLTDDEALGRIRDLLLDADNSIIERNKNKRLSRGKA